jgi:murein DD-endopeptidase MepM/ murein hydrolase activator NlpD
VPTTSLPDLIGVPNVGTHTRGNWQSDNAVDVAAPRGTPVYSAFAGRVGKVGPLGSDDPALAGVRVNVHGSGGDAYYAHLDRAAPGIAEGVQVRAGQLLGFTGSANNVEHLHFAVSSGDPRSLLELVGPWRWDSDWTAKVTGDAAGWLGGTAEAAAGLALLPFGGIGGLVTDPTKPLDAATAFAEGTADLARFLVSVRFAELVGGGLLVLVGLYLLGRQFGVGPSPLQVASVVPGGVNNPGRTLGYSEAKPPPIRRTPTTGTADDRRFRAGPPRPHRPGGGQSDEIPF